MAQPWMFIKMMMKIINCEQDFFCNDRIVSAVKRVEFASDRMPYIVLRGHWCNIITWNVHAQSEEKSDDSRDNFYEELEQVFDHFPKYYVKIMLGDLNAKVWRKNTFKNRQLGTRVYIRIVIIMVLEY